MTSHSLTPAEAIQWMHASGGQLPTLLNHASALTDRHKGPVVTFARKIFVSLIHRRTTTYTCCQQERSLHQHGLCLLLPAEVEKLASLGQRAGCKEALFTAEQLTPEERMLVNNALAEMGYDTTVAYLSAMCRLVFEQFHLIPHPNTHGMSYDDLAMLRPYAGSLTVTYRLAQGQEEQQHSLERLRNTGQQKAPVTVILPIGQGETVEERVQALFELAGIQDTFGHIQEVVIHNAYVDIDHRTLLDIVRTVAVARLVLGGEMNIQGRSVLTPEAYELCMMAGVNDWGGVIVDNPDLPDVDWHQYDSLRQMASNLGLNLRERLTVHPKYLTPDYIAPQIYEHARNMVNNEGLLG